MGKNFVLEKDNVEVFPKNAAMRLLWCAWVCIPWQDFRSWKCFVPVLHV